MASSAANESTRASDAELLCFGCPSSGASNQLVEAVLCVTNRLHNRESQSRVQETSIVPLALEFASQSGSVSPSPLDVDHASPDRHAIGLVLDAEVARNRLLADAQGK